MDGEIKVKDVNLECIAELEKQIERTLAKKVLQIFYVSTDGRISFPLGHFPTTGLTGKEAVEIISRCIEELKQSKGISIQTQN